MEMLLIDHANTEFVLAKECLWMAQILISKPLTPKGKICFKFLPPQVYRKVHKL